MGSRSKVYAGHSTPDQISQHVLFLKMKTPFIDKLSYKEKTTKFRQGTETTKHPPIPLWGKHA